MTQCVNLETATGERVSEGDIRDCPAEIQTDKHHTSPVRKYNTSTRRKQTPSYQKYIIQRNELTNS